MLHSGIVFKEDVGVSHEDVIVRTSIEAILSLINIVHENQFEICSAHLFFFIEVGNIPKILVIFLVVIPYYNQVILFHDLTRSDCDAIFFF